MYILLNELGNVITSILHTDKPIRQGNDFDLHICFPHEPQYRNLSPFVELSLDGNFVIAGTNDWDEWGIPIVFRRIDLNEAVFEFKPGETYYSYHIVVGSDFTQNSGSLPMVISTVLDKITRQGGVVLNVLKTYGSDTEEGVNVDNFETLMMQIKKSTDLYTFSGEPFDENAEGLDNVVLYCWKTLGFVSGVAYLKTSIASLPAFPNNPGYAAIAIFRDAVKVTLPTIFLAHTEDGDDIELKVVGDEDGNVFLLVNKQSDLSINEEFFFNGQFMASQSTIQFADPEDADNAYRITRVSATAEIAESAGVTYALNQISDEDAYELAFDFHLPSTNFGGVISEDLTVGGDLDVGGDITAAGDLIATQDWSDARYLKLAGGTITGDLAVTRTIRASGNLAAKGYWLSSPDQNIIKLDNTVGDLGELQFGIPSGDYAPTFYGSLGVDMWDGRTKEYPTVKFNYYDSNDDYESTVEEPIATQQWSDARYLKLAGGTITGSVFFNSSASFNSPVTIHSPLTLDSGLTVSGLEIHAGNEDHYGNVTFRTGDLIANNGIKNRENISFFDGNEENFGARMFFTHSMIAPANMEGVYIDKTGVHAFSSNNGIPANVLVIRFDY